MDLLLSMRLPAVMRTLMFSVLALQLGCPSPPVVPWSPHVTEDTRARIRTIRIVVSEELPRVTLDLPSKGAASGAGRKAGKWSGNWVVSALGVAAAGRELGVTTGAAMIAVTPVVASTGAVYGAVQAPSRETVESQEAQARGVLQADDLLQRVQHQVVKQVTDRTDVSIATPPRAVPGQFGSGEAVLTSVTPQPDVLLRIQLSKLDLRGKFDVDPPLALHLEAEATLTSLSETTPLYARSFRYVTGAHRLTEWTSDDAILFNGAVDLSLARMAELIVDHLFLTCPFAHEHPTGKHVP